MTPDGPDETAAPAAGPSDDGKIVRSGGLRHRYSVLLCTSSQ